MALVPTSSLYHIRRVLGSDRPHVLCGRGPGAKEDIQITEGVGINARVDVVTDFCADKVRLRKRFSLMVVFAYVDTIFWDVIDSLFLHIRYVTDVIIEGDLWASLYES